MTRHPCRVLLVVIAGLVGCNALLDFDGLVGTRPEDASTGDASMDASSEEFSGKSAYATAVLADGPLAYWRFGEREGSSARDEIGQTSGTYFGSVALGSPGAIANDPDTAIELAGPAAGVSVGTGFGFPGSASFSLEAWVRAEGTDTEYRSVWNRTAPDSKGRQGYAVYLRDGRVSFERHVDGIRLGVTGPMPLGRFSHLVATYDAARLALFVDGLEVDATADARPASALDETLFLGVANLSALPVLGRLDEAAIYGAALVPAQIKAHFAASGGH